jgi:hypothetical protein
MATKKRSEAEFQGRLSVRLSMTWLAKVGASVGQDSSWAVRWAVDHAMTTGARPLLKTVVAPDAARKAGGA